MITTTSPLFLPMVIGTALFAIVVLSQFGLAASGWGYRDQLLEFATQEDRDGRCDKADQARTAAAAEAKDRATSALNAALLSTALLAVAWLIPWDFLARGNL